jgi:hypothetical protein
LLGEISESPGPNDAPIQLLITTHSHPFIQAMKNKIPVKINASGYTVFPNDTDTDIGPVIEGVIPYSHPLFAYPEKRLVIVEGTQDKKVIESYLRHSGKDKSYQVVRVSDLTHRASGDNSDTQMVKYLKRSAAALAMRAVRGGLMIIFEANVSEDEIKKIKSSINSAIDSFHVSGNKDNFLTVAYLRRCKPNPQLDESFPGIERFLPTDVVLQACKTKGITLSQQSSNGSKIYTLPPAQTSSFRRHVKQTLFDSFCSRTKYIDADWVFLKDLFN